MNKTVNINLAGIFFHIDEDAYLKLQRYLEAIKRSFTDSQGQSEIIADIEARISELFNERINHDKQIIGLTEVNEIITIMGQPEDYLVDEEIFDDEPYTDFRKKSKATFSKKLFRDKDNSYIGGVASGMGHYLGIDAIWIRLLLILLALGSAGTLIFIYVLCWILVPEAITTADKLTMTGEPVNISNIEKKIKDGFGNVSEAVKNMDLPKQGNKLKASSKIFFDTLGEIILFLLKVAGKFIGIILIVIGASALIGLVVALFSVGVAEIIQVPGIDFIHATNTTSIPFWLMSLLLFFVISIPFFFVFYIGLKILINNLKPIGQIAKFSLLGLWLLSTIGLVVIGIKQASEYTDYALVQHTENIHIAATDTLYINMLQNKSYTKQFGRNSNQWKPIYDQNGQKQLYLTDVSLLLKSTKDSVASIKIEKSSRSDTYQKAKERAEKIEYNYKLIGNQLELDGFLTTAYENKYRDQEVEVTLYLPEGTILFAEKNTYRFYKRPDARAPFLGEHNFENHYLQLVNDEITCLDCPAEPVLEDDQNNTSKVRIDKEGIKIQNKTNSVEINQNGIHSSSDRVKVNIDRNGIKISTDDQ